VVIALGLRIVAEPIDVNSEDVADTTRLATLPSLLLRSAPPEVCGPDALELDLLADYCCGFTKLECLTSRVGAPATRRRR
jgi:hypothetical protein